MIVMWTSDVNVVHTRNLQALLEAHGQVESKEIRWADPTPIAVNHFLNDRQRLALNGAHPPHATKAIAM